MKEFTVVLSGDSSSPSSSVETILAPDSEHAAWQALELAVDRDAQLVDVRPYVNFDW